MRVLRIVVLNIFLSLLAILLVEFLFEMDTIWLKKPSARLA
jgi:hypothetical protein